MDDDEEICVVCDSECTCNHLPPNRGSARANGYQAKVAGRSVSGKGDSFLATIKPRPASPALFIPATSSEPPSRPFKIRLILHPKERASTPSMSTLPPLDVSTSSRKRRSLTYTSSSDSSTSLSSRADERHSTTQQRAGSSGPSPTLPMPRHTTPMARAQAPTSGTIRRGRPPKHVVAAREEAARAKAEVQGIFKEAAFGRPIRASAAVASSSLSSSLSGPSRPPISSSSPAGPSKPSPARLSSVTPSSAWFLGVPPTKQHTRSPLPASTQHTYHTTSKPSKAHPKSLIKNTTKPRTKKTVSAPPSRSLMFPNKKRKVDYSPTPSPPRPSLFGNDDSSLGELTPSEGERGGGEYVPPASSAPKTARKPVRPIGNRMSAHRSSGSGIVLGRPVGTVPPGFSKFLSAASSSSSSSSSAEEHGDTTDDEMEEEGILMEEEEMIVKEDRKRQKGRRKARGSGGDRGGGSRRKHHQRGDNVDVSSSLSSVSSSSSKSSIYSSSSSSASSDSGGDEDGEDEESEDEDADADDIPVHTVDPVQWTESEEDEMDADLFFANFLSDEEADEKEHEAEEPGETEQLAPPAEGAGLSEDEDVFAAGFGVNGTNFVDASAFELLQRRRLFRPLNSLSRSRGARGHPYRRPQPTSRKSIKVSEPSVLIKEDTDGQLVFASPFRTDQGIVDTEWEERQLSVLMNDEDVTSEESVSEGDDAMADIGAAAGDAAGDAAGEEGDEDAESTTETDFEGDTTFDEGLDEDGLPPQMAEQSQQLRSELEFNRRRLAQHQHQHHVSNVSLPEILPPGVEVFQGGDATVMYGRHDFPSLNPPPPHQGSLNSVGEFAESWGGIDDDGDASEDADAVAASGEIVDPVVVATTQQDTLAVVEAGSMKISPTPRDILSGAWASLDNFRFPFPAPPQVSSPIQTTAVPLELSPDDTSVAPGTMDEAPVSTVNAAELPSTMLPEGELRHSPEQEEGLSPSPPPLPRKLPKMGSFAFKAPHDVVDTPATSGSTQTSLETPSATTEPYSKTITGPSSADPSSSRQSIWCTPRKAVTVESGSKGVAVIDGTKGFAVPSPYASVKRRKKARAAADESDESMSMSQRSDAAINWDVGPWDYSRIRRTTSVPRSARSSFSQTFPVLSPSLLPPSDETTVKVESSFLHPADVLDTPTHRRSGPPASINLFDVLDLTFLDEEESATDAPCTEDDDSAVDGGALRNLTRWDRVPMGTFRRARAFGSAGANSQIVHGQPHHGVHSSPSDGFSYGAMFRGPAGAADGASVHALWSDASPGAGTSAKWKEKDVARHDSSKVRSKVRPSIVISPVIFPIAEDVVAESGEPEDIDMGWIPGVAEEEGYFSKKSYKGGRDGTERERKKRKFDRETASRSPVHKRPKSGTSLPGAGNEARATEANES